VTTRVVHVVVLFTLIALLLARNPARLHAQTACPCPRDATPASTTPPPSNIRVDELLQPLVSALLEKSVTFRRQWTTINASRIVRVAVQARMGMSDDGAARARAQVTRYAHGSIRVVIEIAVGIDLTELLPHELEHVIEQVEGVDLPVLARQGEQGVTEVRRGIYETARARAAGRRVVDEVYGKVDPALGAAANGIKRLLRALPDPGSAAARQRSRQIRPPRALTGG